MKNVTSIILSIALLLVFIMPNESLAQDQSLEKLIMKSKQILEIGDEYTKFEYSISKNEGITTYNFNWRNEEETDNISVNIDSEGFIMSYDKYSYQDNYENKIPKVTDAEGKKISEDFLKKINPEIKDRLEYKGNDKSKDIFINRYYFNFVRSENGIPYVNNAANVNVDSMTGEVKSYYVSWDKDVKFPKDEGNISKEEAAQLYKEKVKFELMYKYSFTGKEKKPMLVYSIEDKNKSINAKTGELLDYSNDYFDGGIQDSGKGGEESNKALTQEELEAIKADKDMISESQAEAIARESAKIDKSYKLSYLNMLKHQDGYRWYLDFTKQEDNKYEGAQVSIDVKTKEVIYFNKYTEGNSKGKQKYSKEQALNIAKEYLNKVQAEKSKQVEYIEMSYPRDQIYQGEYAPTYSFNFTRKVNDKLFQGDGFDIRVDSSSGEIIGYDSSWYKGELPKADGVVSKEQAYKTFTSQAKLELQYIKMPLDDKKENNDTILAYVLGNKDKLDIDAKTGKPIDLYSYGMNTNEEKPVYTDIDNSIAKKQIATLMELGIYLPGEKFKPKAEITQSDFLYLLYKTKDSYINYGDIEELYKTLIGQKIIKKEEKAPDSNITREEAVKYIIRSLNYDRVADIKNIYKLEFKDQENIDPNLRGYVAIAKGLGIVNGTADGKFRPTDSLNREQAILIIYNVLDSKK